MTPHFHPLTITEIRPETPDAVSIAFAVPDALAEAYRFTPGQYLTLKTEHEGEELRRSYSICSGLDDGELRVAVKKIVGGRFSGLLGEAIRPGQTLEVMTPMGRFGVAPEPEAVRTYVGLACGSGITPILSIVKSALTREPRSRFFLFYGNRTSASIIFRETLEDLKDRFVERLSVFHILSREAQDVPILNGRLDAKKIALLLRAVVPASEVDHVFVCGPSGMLEDAEAALKTLGLRDEQIHFERFTPAEGGAGRPAPRPIIVDETPKAVAEIILDGVRHSFPVAEGEAIVDAALRAGLDLPYSCKGGMCCTCRGKIVEGEVEMIQNYSLEPWEIAAGYALTCQSLPKTARVVVDYDHF
ncbi:MAG TPA: 1,2-phenylacetyl-CoA epoxidase subunit PaaE [Beijerinckiaceae bacterium]|nr:1,2-phenylacetyl-CoA epoxidase subunit PaaE [Beijerinckiaceae bacterium]